ncbi:MAG: hypothetical protein AAGI06_13820 [Pseudomonadota bacterium]
MTEDALMNPGRNTTQAQVNDEIEKAFKGIRNEEKKFEIADFDFGGDDFGWM